MNISWLPYLIMMLTIITHFAYATSLANNQLEQQISKLEKSLGGKIGVYAIDTANNEIIQYRGSEHFPIQSTMKLIAVSDLLNQSSRDKNLLDEKVHYTQRDMVYWHPITEKYLSRGMTFESLASATISYSDNPAANLIIKKLGGPKAITEFAHSIGNTTFNIKHYETKLNSDPTNVDDSSTPKDMAISLQKLTLGNILTLDMRKLLIAWMIDNKTGDTRIRAGVPTSYVVADKTGSGDYGIANDIGLLWAPNCKPVVLAIYTVQNSASAKRRDDIVATTAHLILTEFAKHNTCLKSK